MNNIRTKRIAIWLLILAFIINLVPIPKGNGEVIVTPMVEHANAATPTPMPSPTLTPTQGTDKFFMVVDSTKLGFGDSFTMAKNQISLSITNQDNAVVEDATIEWLPYDSTVIDVVFGANKFVATLHAKGPGYSQLGAIVTYGGLQYQVYCQVYVPLELGDSSVNLTQDSYGLRTQIQANDAKKQTLLLQGPEAVAGVNQYLVKLKSVAYKSGVTNWPATVTPGAIFERAPSVIWESSDTTIVEVDNNGLVKAVGAGYAEITVSTTTVSEKSQPAKLTFPVLVGVTGKINGTSDPYKAHIEYQAHSSTVTIDSNASIAKNLIWTFHQGETISGKEIDPKKNDLMEIYISPVSGSVTLSNVKAGVYYITARQSKNYAEDNANIKMFTMKLVVPITLPTGPIYMNVGDTYKILENANLPFEGIYQFSSSDINIATVGAKDGMIKALANGNSIKINMTYNNSAALFPTALSQQLIASGVLKESIALDVFIIDGLSLSLSNAAIYTAGTIQLTPNTTNPTAPLKWSSSDDKIATVSDNGLVTGVKEGKCVISVTQVVNGVTKTATCKILVKATITGITLDPSTASLEMGKFLTVNANVTPKMSGISLKWVVSDEKIISITQAGDLSATVTGVAGGTAVLTAINQDNVVVGSCLITVYEGIQSITLSETNVKTSLSAKTFQLFASVTPANAKDQELIWMSTDPSVITVDQNGTVTLKKAGKASIMVTSKVNAAIFAICNVEVTKAVTGLKLDNTTKAMFAGETFRLTYTISPADANNMAITWTSSNPAIAAVNKEGLISAKSVGTTVIIARTNDGGFIATCTVTVGRTATAVKLDVTKLTLNVGDYYALITTLTPADSTETVLVWESSDKAVADVSKSGRVTAKSAGQAIIMVKTKSGSTGYCTVTVLQGVTGIEISETEATVAKDETYELTAQVIPDDATDQGVTWSSSDTEIATVNEEGIVKGIAGGVVIITATSDDGEYVSHCIMTVEELITEITLDKTYYKLGRGKTFRLTATIKGANASNQKLYWASSKKSIATVDKNGRVKGIKNGTATIYAKATDGSGAYATCVVRVSTLVTSIDLDVTYKQIVQGKSYTLKSTVKPANATFKVPIYTSSDSKVAIVNKKGTITALSPGDTVITATANDSSGISAICYVNVIAPVPSSGITVAESEVVMMPGESKTITAAISPAKTTDSYSWSSDNTSVATVVKSTGRIVAKTPGTANITVMTESGRRASVRVIVVGLSRTTIDLEQYSTHTIFLDIGDTAGINIRWDTENAKIATVNNGEITSRAIGSANVYAVINGRRLACTVNVKRIE